MQVSWKAAACAAIAFGTSASTGAAPDFPVKPVALVVPFPPGGPTDVLARQLASGLRARLGQTVVVENRAGAGGNIGAEYVARAVPDGYTILFGTSGPLAINASLYKKQAYDPATDFEPVYPLGYLPNILVVHPSVPAATLPELMQHAKANAGKLTFASSGNGASSHLAGVLFNNLAGTDIQHIPYKGTGPALNDLLGGQVSMSFTDVLTALPHVQSNKLRAIGLTTAARSPVLPNLPTLAEQGLKNYDVSVFFGIVAPKGTSKEVVARLNQAFAATMASAETKELLAKQGIVPFNGTTPETLQAIMASENAKWRTVVKTSGASLD